MMKKWLCLALALMLCPVMALADTSGAALTFRELTEWAEGYIARAMTAAPLNDPASSLTPDGYEFVFNFATLYADTPVMGADTIVNTVVLTSDEERGLRNVSVGNALPVVLEAYYGENDGLLGTKESAVLYTMDNLPESASWGQVQRDGQRVRTVQYAVHEQLATGGAGYTDAGVIYTFAENRVSAVRVYGLNSRIGLDTVNDVMYAVMMDALRQEYAMVPFSYDGLSLTAFAAEDLIFSGLDFRTLTPDEAIAVLGEPHSDLWMDNGDSGFLRVQTFSNGEFIYMFNRARTMGQLYMVSIHADGLEGPRAVRIGDSFASVYNRFRNGEGEYQEDGSEILYGAKDAASYGFAEYGDDASAVLRYALTLEDGSKVTLQMGFTVMALTEILIYVE